MAGLLPSCDVGATPQRHAAVTAASLATTALFQDFTPGELDQVARRARVVTRRRGQVLFAPGEAGQFLFVLQEGRVMLYRLSTEGRRLVLATFGPPGVFGELSLIGQGAHDCFAEAAEPCTLLALARADIHEILIRKPQFALRLLDQVGQRPLETQTQLEQLAFSSLPERLAILLLRLAERDGTRDEVTGYIHQDLADMLAVARESLSSALGTLRAQGMVAIGRRRVVVLQPERLRGLAGALSVDEAGGRGPTPPDGDRPAIRIAA